MQNCQVLILSAGIGSRMGKQSRLPKCLNDIKQKKVIEMLFEKLYFLGFKDIYLTVGYKSKKIISFLKKKKYTIKKIYIKNFKNCGSVYSWYSFYKIWKKKKKNLILIHSDLLFDISYLNLLKKRKQNIICCSEFNKNKYKSDYWMCTTKKTNIIKSILQYKFLKLNEKKYQISCINKFSPNMLKHFFPYMKKYFLRYGINDTWEIVLNKFIRESNYNIYLYKNAKYWFNINTVRDLTKAKTFFNNESKKNKKFEMLKRST